MKISSLQVDAKGLNITGTLGYIQERKHHQSDTGGKNNKGYDFFSQFCVINNAKGKVANPLTGEEMEIEEDSIGVNIISDVVVDKADKNKSINCMDCTVREYKDKKTLNTKIIGIEGKEKKAEISPAKLSTSMENRILHIQGRVDMIYELLKGKEEPAPITSPKDNGQVEKATKEQVKLINVMRKKGNIDETQYREYLVSIGIPVDEERGIASSNDIPKDMVNDVLEWLEENKQKEIL